jgi:S-(hydroxymethyl)glutathione dehydrogenase/alcohol dehydrogenase
VLAVRLALDHLVTDRIGLADIPATFERMTPGGGARSIVVF